MLTPERRAELRGLAERAQPFIRHGGTDPAAVYVPAAELAALLDAADEADRLRIWQERVALAAGIADVVEGRGVHLESDPDAAAEHVAGLLAVVDTHVECPIYCNCCGEALADAWCDHCHGSGCGPGTATGAYEECEWCAGAGKVHVGCAYRSYADLVDDLDRLAGNRREPRDLDWDRSVDSYHAAGWDDEPGDYERMFFESGWRAAIRALDGADS